MTVPTLIADWPEPEPPKRWAVKTTHIATGKVSWVDSAAIAHDGTNYDRNRRLMLTREQAERLAADGAGRWPRQRWEVVPYDE